MRSAFVSNPAEEPLARELQEDFKNAKIPGELMAVHRRMQGPATLSPLGPTALLADLTRSS